MVVGLVTLAIVGMLQTLVRVDPAPVDPTWKSGVADEDERGHVAGRAPSTPDAAGPIASNIMGRGGPARETLGDRSVSAAGLRPAASQSRAPPILLSLASRV